MQNFHLLGFPAETSITVPHALLSILGSPGRTGCDNVCLEPPSIGNGAHDTEKLLLKIQVSKILHNQVNLLIYYIPERLICLKLVIWFAYSQCGFNFGAISLFIR